MVELGVCLDLTTESGIERVRRSYTAMKSLMDEAGTDLPTNSVGPDRLKRHLDCAVITFLHQMIKEAGEPSCDTVLGLFMEGPPVYDGAGFHDKTHVQLCVRNLNMIKGAFRVHESSL